MLRPCHGRQHHASLYVVWRWSQRRFPALRHRQHWSIDIGNNAANSVRSPLSACQISHCLETTTLVHDALAGGDALVPSRGSLSYDKLELNGAQCQLSSVRFVKKSCGRSFRPEESSEPLSHQPRGLRSVISCPGGVQGKPQPLRALEHFIAQETRINVGLWYITSIYSSLFTIYYGSQPQSVRGIEPPNPKA